MKRDQITLYRRKLPHWRTLDATYFVTWRVRKGASPLTGRERQEVLDAALHFNGSRYELLACVVVDDHVHAIVMPKTHELTQITHSWKSFSAHRLGSLSARTGGVWESESFDRIIRNGKELAEKIGYLAGNPFKRWPQIENYPWLWLAPQFKE